MFAIAFSFGVGMLKLRYLKTIHLYNSQSYLHLGVFTGFRQFFSVGVVGNAMCFQSLEDNCSILIIETFVFIK